MNTWLRYLRRALDSCPYEKVKFIVVGAVKGGEFERTLTRDGTAVRFLPNPPPPVVLSRDEEKALAMQYYQWGYLSYLDVREICG